jgi:hypothetical protein
MLFLSVKGQSTALLGKEGEMRQRELYTGCRRPLPLQMREERLSWGPEDDNKKVWASSLYGRGEETV